MAIEEVDAGPKLRSWKEIMVADIAQEERAKRAKRQRDGIRLPVAGTEKDNQTYEPVNKGAKRFTVAQRETEGFHGCNNDFSARSQDDFPRSNMRCSDSKEPTSARHRQGVPVEGWPVSSLTPVA